MKVAKDSSMVRAEWPFALTRPPCVKLHRLPQSSFLAPAKLFSRTCSPSPISIRFPRKSPFAVFKGSKRFIVSSSPSPMNSPPPSSSSSKVKKYDVFISFRGEDVRNSFTSHLFTALCREKIETYLDSEKLRQGKDIPPALFEAIEESRIAVVIFSRCFASSRWCLDELLKILECKKKNGLIVLPVFFDITPTIVRRQTASYAMAFAAHEIYYGRKSAAAAAKVKQWRAALTEAANLSGFDSDVIRPESKLTEEIVACILKSLGDLWVSSQDDLVGAESNIKAVEKLLGTEKDNFRCVGIWGMAGIGKTTIAGAIFNHICGRFEGCCFLADVREQSKQRQLFTLRNEILQQILDRKDINIQTPDIGQRFLRDRLRSTRALIVLDDVSSLRQLEFLVKDIRYFRPGSRLIVTSRDKDVLKHGFDAIYEVKGLADKDALELFFRCALKENLPSEDHLRIAKRVLQYANKNPLALKVLGSFLYQKTLEEWESAWGRLQNFPDAEIQQILEISCEDLPTEEMDIFLDIACFFNGEDTSFVTRMLDGCGFDAIIGIRALIDKSLLTISKNRLQMHNLIQETGKEIVRKKAPRVPGRRSRLWDHDDIYEVLTTNEPADAVECISLNLSEVKEMQLSARAFEKLYNLRFLKFYTTEGSDEKCKVHFPEGLKFLPNKLRYLHWHSYPLNSFPPDFCPEFLVKLSMRYSSLERLWDGSKDLNNLRWIDLCYSMNLKHMPDLSGAPKLEHVTLRGCRKLVGLVSISCKLKHLELLDLSGCSNLKEFPEISWDIKELLLEETAIEELPPTIRNFHQLVRLDMRNCKMLKNASTTDYELASLEYLSLSGCSKVTKFPEISRNLQKLLLNETEIDEIPSSVIFLGKLILLDLQNCKRLESLPSSICNLKSLQELNLSGCSSFHSFPEILGTMDALSCLNLNGAAIKELPSSVEHLSVLSSLDLGNCKNLVSLPDEVCKLKFLKDLNLSGCLGLENLPKCSGIMPLRKLRANRCNSQVIGFLSENLFSLETLDLSECGLLEFPDILTLLTSLVEVDISKNDFEKVPPSIIRLTVLQNLDISYCDRLHSLPELPSSVSKLVAHNCSSLEVILRNNGTENRKVYYSYHLETFVFTNCYKLNQDAKHMILQYAERRIHTLTSYVGLTLNLLGCTSDYAWMPDEKIRCILSTRHECKDFGEALGGLYQVLFNEDPLAVESRLTILIQVVFTILSRCELDFQGQLRFVTWLAALFLSYLDKPSTNFCFPGSNLPEWLKFQNVGSHITMTFEPSKPSDVHSQFVGFAVCVAIEFGNYNEDNGFSVKCKYHLQTEELGSYDGVFYLRGWGGQQSKPIRVEGDHLFLGCDFSLIFEASRGMLRYSNNLREVSFEFFAVDGDDNPLKCCSVTKCGMLPLYFRDMIPSEKETLDRDDNSKGREDSRGYDTLLLSILKRYLYSSYEFVHDQKNGSIYLAHMHYFVGEKIFARSIGPAVSDREHFSRAEYMEKFLTSLHASDRIDQFKDQRVRDTHGVVDKDVKTINWWMLLLCVIGIFGLSWCFIHGWTDLLLEQ
ncbi:PREDICTED: TMV resistance protein N-like [Tarenaya hassleriana]|uniref:TMV resistance protein N-like n=1 Tax=Tarenaya hassleriana TaxID=28532 RepID=UPI00053C09BF|nr:PREDICTED: TMV resistance protein N-like [Tarenaya hassleriana]